jgi:UDP-2-acetamido-3-amino-2,3-dideoxy-glucuronate N-acetyltransferase
VVTKNVPDYAMVYGSRARIRGYVCQCGEKMEFTDGKATCPACGKKYQMNENNDVEEI